MTTAPEVVVTGVGLMSALGPDAASNWSRLLLGETAIALRQPFAELPVVPLALIGKHPARLQDLVDQAVDEALQDAQISLPQLDCGVVIGSSRSHQVVWEKMAAETFEHGQPPAGDEWLASLPHMAAINTARRLGTLGPVQAPMAACATGLWAIFQGWELIRRGQCDRVLAGAVEAPITPLALAGFERMGALAQQGCYPFDLGREGLVLGEGAAVLVLESAALAQARGAHSYGKILGVGLTADGHHLSAPDPQRQSSEAALRACLRQAHLLPSEVGYLHAHGTSTRLNDAHEAALIQQVFPADVAVSSTKGSTGHTLGASGAIGTVFCLLALQNQVLPPCVGLAQPAFPLNFVRQATPQATQVALCLSFGFGGQNAVLALGSS
ncbi:beta-ketoacyl-ACP synthase [Pseudanabaena sp. FACHB-2040]|uniref:beta-ketoacyl-ACP synthase n=1 Tax=Pseudanabaena sp. FACHB-2040 TaxID=2692859 RepID=UPI0032206DF2